MNCLIKGDILVILIWILDRTVFNTYRATCAFVFFYISWFPYQCYMKITYLTFYLVDLCIGENLYIWMPADLDQFRCENSHGAVIGGKGLIKLCHMATDTRRLFHQVNLEACRCQVKGCLDAAYATPDNHDISKIALTEHFS